MINLKMNKHDAIVLSHALFMYTKDHPGFFSDDSILKIRKINQQLNKEIENLIDAKEND